ncbi:hypothetical protein A3L04_06725 [Thermococcus chitonophagus]|uniref:Uncharacterized protein n=1 Tax=Thermococcus chitonophagus TaxID=54262 RepID=A0A160VTG8_9EURY|nr:hypothetical protein [Thermococcus chitonophagus]ASJ16790.1 hypothetical protein A3L04_06725 [Thermococcus chitonophagus]CUX78262.1 hypothetical protein CHITON_1483 [Thermococcus chitonophagus]
MEKDKVVGIASVIVGYLLAAVSMYLLGYTPSLKSFLFGILGMIIALVIQFPLQFSVIFLRDKLGLSTGPVAVGLGLSAGFSQELVKYVLLNGKDISVAVAFGLGIGLFEALYAAPMVLYKEDLPEHMKSLVEKTPWLGIWERYFATLFHIVTSVILTYGGITWLIILIVLHGIVDSIGELHNLGGNRTALIITEILLCILSLALFLASPL